MDQIKIGKLISDSRKRVSLTQLQLAEQLGITDKAVSKWERGIAMPDASIMLALCEILGISVHELLSGEKQSMENDRQNNEQLLLRMAKELEEKNKTIWSSMWLLMLISIVALCLGIVIIFFLIPAGAWQLIAIFTLVGLFMIPCLYALKLEVSVGVYRCGNCGHEMVPTYSEALNAMHLGTTRYLKCPCCNKRSWCKKVRHK